MTEEQRSARELAILDAALDLVSEQGFDCVSMDSVAARARASKATIYRHWAGKQELVVDALRCRTGVDNPPADTGSLRGDLLATVQLISEAMTGPEGQLVVGLLLAKQRDPALAALVEDQLHEAKRAFWLAICGRAEGRGELHDAERAADALHEVVPGIAFLAIVVLGRAGDAPWRLHVVDDILLPLLTGAPLRARSTGSAPRPT